MDKDKKAIPQAWLNKPELIELANQHQAWCVQAFSQKIKCVIELEEDRLVNLVSATAVTPTKTSEEVRMYAAQLNSVRQIKKIIYDTEKFIERIER